MSRLDSIPVSLITILCALVSGACASHSTDDQKLLTCFKCLGNDTECRDICTGYYCYKYEIKGHMSGPVKKGCLNATDALSKVDECTLRNTTIGKLSVAENFCLCTTDRCNSAPAYIFSAVHSLLLVIFGLLFYNYHIF